MPLCRSSSTEKEGVKVVDEARPSSGASDQRAETRSGAGQRSVAGVPTLVVDLLVLVVVRFKRSTKERPLGVVFGVGKVRRTKIA